MTRIQANLLLTLVALISGSAFVFQSQGMAHVGPMAFTGVRFLLGALVVLPLMLWEWRKLQRTGLALQPMDVLQIAGLGSLLLLGAAMQQIGIMSTRVTNAGFLTALYVPLVPVLGWLLLRHRPHWSAWPAALACVVGAYLLSGAQDVAISLGDWWIIGSTLPWAVHVMLIGRVADRMAAPFLVAGGQFAVCGLVALGWGLLFEPLSWTDLQAAALPIAYTGILSVGVAFTAQVVAQRYAYATDAAMLLSSEAVFAAAFGYVLMDDRLNAVGLMGCALIFISMLGVQLLPLLQNRHL
ncbi:MAG: DMT family transporter [Rhodoferax sp.]|nr:DMT family transporter [Rhodoferax sp.]OIP21089.1 MAG: EamA family transporter [Comamonadaceae bacterium CG2_30_60_41]PIW07633.1 MAG: EamA/RhaT family transporter [Comamonadaceae bacterium CG17_big_fil_post_rev_8_21_14_2_50_60_13]PIY23841.1 MAG: EamA/RhaT family transporter [Comamonadaceae bacterium CG_4_10_14_3_um_filter_60_75]PJC11759.1 MAG: EamA/RhaT family transporter [Comamonadaceae bacterium CG_4_9_14_0_8_um_filter_60_18]